MLSGSQEAFLELVRAGLWEIDARLIPFNTIDYGEVYRLAQEQSVTGLVAAGLEHVVDIKVPKDDIYIFIGDALQLEQRNTAMNLFIKEAVGKLNHAGIYSILVKGQGVAQCYSRPLWRASGDIDFLLSEDNYYKAKSFLAPVAASIEEDENRLHLSMVINPWIVELHGALWTDFSKRVDICIDEVQQDVFSHGNVRIWKNDRIDIYLPEINNDVIFIFTHYLQHFFIEGVGLRQICDWCRLLWTNKQSIDKELLKQRLSNAGLMTEWLAFASLAVNFLGMPAKYMPFYDESRLYKAKAKRILKRIIKTGNMGHNNDMSYRKKYAGTRYKIVSFWRRLCDFAGLSTVFPVDAPRFFVTYVFRKIKLR